MTSTAKAKTRQTPAARQKRVWDKTAPGRCVLGLLTHAAVQLCHRQAGLPQLRPPASSGLLPLRETAPGQGQLADRPCLCPLLRLHPLPSSALPCLRHRPAPDRPGQQRRADLRAVRRARR